MNDIKAQSAQISRRLEVRAEKKQELDNKFPNLKLTPQEFVKNNEKLRIHKNKSEWFKTNEKVDQLNKKVLNQLVRHPSADFTGTLPLTSEEKNKQFAMEHKEKGKEFEPKVKSYLHEGYEHRNAKSPNQIRKKKEEKEDSV